MKSRTRPPEIEPAALSIPAAAAYLSVPPDTVRSWLRFGRLRAVRIGRRILVSKREIDAIVDGADRRDA